MKDGAERVREQEVQSTGGGGMRERMRGDGGRVKKNCVIAKKKKKHPGHLVRWNYISNAHTACMLLSHQHIAQTGMVYVHVCVNVSACVCG